MIESIKEFLKWLINHPDYSHLSDEEREKREEDDFWNSQW